MIEYFLYEEINERSFSTLPLTHRSRTHDTLVWSYVTLKVEIGIATKALVNREAEVWIST